MKSCIILCGGRGTRMGRDKGSLILDDKPLILHLIHNLNDFFDEILIILRDEKQIEFYKNFIKKNDHPYYNLKFLKDEISEQGPLVGILTGLTRIKSDYALILPCDSPFVTKSFLNNIFHIFETEKINQKSDNIYDSIIPQWDNGDLEPLHAIYTKKAIPKIKKLLKNKTNDVKSLTKQLKIKYVNVKDLDKSKVSFRNINRPEDIISF
ncbi:MAG: molybdenum cofactor guanylyltransferase [Methanobacteriaceae archaeon]|nr:molybdenum cofactor guanylyltransferase [Methanobacteriaceae archaeon]